MTQTMYEKSKPIFVKLKPSYIYQLSRDDTCLWAPPIQFYKSILLVPPLVITKTFRCVCIVLDQWSISIKFPQYVVIIQLWPCSKSAPSKNLSNSHLKNLQNDSIYPRNKKCQISLTVRLCYLLSKLGPNQIDLHLSMHDKLWYL